MNRISTLTLHRYRLGELSADEAAAVRAALEANPADAARLRAQEAMRAEFALRPVPAALRTPERRAERPSFWALWRMPILAAAAAMGLLLVLPTAPPAPEHTRLKGHESRVDVLVEGHGLLDAGELLHAGDRVQLRLPAGPYVEAWVSDGERVLGRFDAYSDRPSLAPFALTLDDEPGEERVVLLLARQKMAAVTAQKILNGEPASGVEQVTVRLPKVR